MHTLAYNGKNGSTKIFTDVMNQNNFICLCVTIPNCAFDIVWYTVYNRELWLKHPSLWPPLSAGLGIVDVFMQ